MKRMTMGAVAAGLLLVAGCSSTDPYYEALDEAGWDSGALEQDEREDLFEGMAAEVCGQIRDGFDTGLSDSEVMDRALRTINSADPTSPEAVAALDAMLDHRCDASQADGLKAS